MSYRIGSSFYWRFIVFFSLFLSLFSLHAQSDEERIVRFTVINGASYSNMHPSMIFVHPGDVVSLAADLVYNCDSSSSCASVENLNVSQFAFRADDRTEDYCDGAAPWLSQNCLDTSSFDVKSDGVQFYVPYSMNNDIRVTVIHKASGYTDSLVLKKELAAPEIPATPVQGISDYNYSSFEYETALAGHGRWVIKSGRRVWLPYSPDSNWAPYHHGYWTWVERRGLTWVSYDDFGWVTDHYGNWYRDDDLGSWVWVPDPDYTYYPHTVRFYYGDDYVGWYPYDAGYRSGYRAGYRAGYDNGYDQGYWDGYNATFRPYNPGFVFVSHDVFFSRNIFDVRIAYGHDMYFDYWQRAYRGGYVGFQFGDGSYAWLSSRCGTVYRTTEIERRYGGVVIYNPAPVHRVPDYYNGFRAQREAQYRAEREARFYRPIPAGAVVRHDPVAGRPVIIPPHDRGGWVRPVPGPREPSRPGPVVPGPRQPSPAPTPVPPPVSRPVPIPPPHRPDPRPEQPIPSPRVPERPRHEPAPVPPPVSRPVPIPPPVPRRPDPAPVPRPAPSPSPRPVPTRPRDPSPAPRAPSPRPAPPSRGGSHTGGRGHSR